MKSRYALLICASATALAATPAMAQSAPDAAVQDAAVQDAAVQAGPAEPAETGGLEDIVVTAQKRAESANRVGMSISAFSGETLVQKGVTAPSELVRIIPGFTYTEAPRGAPVFAIRGIGFDDSTLGSASTVALYVDEVPLSYPVEARFAALDLERVEVLKGPQGILFGQNSTAGAINFIAAKPTDSVSGGIDASYSRFNTIDVRGFLSAPLTDTLKVRIAAMTVQSGDWQKSYTRNDGLGEKHQFAARFLAQWDPTDALTLLLSVNGWIDRSDTQAVQLVEAFPLLPNAAPANYSFYPRAPHNARAADWDPNPEFPLERDDNFFQASLRGDYRFNENVTFTSITSFSRYNQEFALDVDGADIQDFLIGDNGKVRSFNQEIRLTADFDQLKLIVGGNYSRDKVHQANQYRLKDSSVFFGFLGNRSAGSFFDEPIRNIAAFGNVDYSFNDVITVHGGIRYTEDKRRYTGCTTDAGDGIQAGVFNIIYGIAYGGTFNIQPGGCTSNTNGVPGLARFKLNENNVSWRAGVDFQVTPTTLLYANVSRGYKSGSFPSVNVVANEQLEGVKQESVLAYEAGIKAGLFNRMVQINAAGFYNDYSDKQLRGRILDPFGFFGILDKLLNIPKSRVYGAELQVQVAPATGLNMSFGGTYTNTKVTDDFFAYDPVGNLFNYKGLVFPHTPKWAFNASADYEAPISSTLNGFVGANISYHSKAISLFADRDLIAQSALDPLNRPGVKVPRDAFDEKAYTIVDAQIGVAHPDNKWRAWIWGKNIFNTYYWSNSTQSFDSIYRIASMPRTYGATVSLRF